MILPGWLASGPDFIFRAVKLEKLNRRPVVNDKSYAHATRGTIRRNQDIVARNGGLQILHHKSHMGHLLNEVGNRAPLFKSHPLDTEGTLIKAGYKNPEALKVSLSLSFNLCGDSQMVVFHGVSYGIR